MKYFASEQLAQILLKNGFKETTKKYYPKHFERINKEGYNPQIFKRSFSFGRKMSITFDYINIIGGGPFASFTSDSLEEDDLKSILTFLKLPIHTQTAIRKRCKNVLDISSDYKQICENPDWRTGATDVRIKETFSEIRI